MLGRSVIGPGAGEALLSHVTNSEASVAAFTHSFGGAWTRDCIRTLNTIAVATAGIAPSAKSRRWQRLTGSIRACREPSPRVFRINHANAIQLLESPLMTTVTHVAPLRNGTRSVCPERSAKGCGKPSYGRRVPVSKCESERVADFHVCRLYPGRRVGIPAPRRGDSRRRLLVYFEIEDGFV